jgi:hypothetical protein
MSYGESSRSAAPVVVVIVLGAAAALGWYVWGRNTAPSRIEMPLEAGPPAAVALDEGPEFPLPPAMPERERPGELTPLPALDDSDRYFELELSGVLGPGVAELLVDDALIEKFVATIDNLPRLTVAERIRPVGRLSDPFAVDGQDGSDLYTMNPANFDRYDLLVTMLERADRDEIVDVYRRFYPLFRQAFVNLGYPDGYFNDRLVEVIDHLLATPDVDDSVRLVRPHVLYEFENPELEALSAGQKLLLRIGSEHRLVIKQFLEEIRDRITSSPAE